MIHAVVMALFHNKISRVTLGSTPQGAVSLPVAQWLKPMLESNTSLTTVTLHTQYIPPESLKVVLLGASRCRGLQYLRLVGGISVLQSKVLMSALAHFTLSYRPSRPSTDVRCRVPNGEEYSHAQRVAQPSPSGAPERENGRFALKACEAQRANDMDMCCNPIYQRLCSPALLNARAAGPPSPCIRQHNGVHVVLDVQHMDDVVAAFLVRGLERAERVIGLDVHVSSVSQTASRAAARLLSRTESIIKLNAERLGHLLARCPSPVPQKKSSRRHAENAVRLGTSPHSPLCRPNAGADGGPPRPPTADPQSLPTRRYSPPRLLPEHPCEPHSPPPRPLGAGAPHRLFSTPSVTFTADGDCAEEESDDNTLTGGEGRGEGDKEECEEIREANKECESAPPNNRASPNTDIVACPFQKLEQKKVEVWGSRSTVPGSPSPCYKPHAPLHQPPSHQGQLVQHMRHMRNYVKDINSVVVRYQVGSRETVQRMVTAMQQLEEQLTQSVTEKLTDMLVTISEVERPET
ncbi:hypothetical protein, conserved [Trypanosoma brucei gambiense DAL972]|uniref:Uncharacterized protein n=1 Tax=Trypanosoma brucei gambiense (strain MHOM/CI/86/DAL972) TaxID=679716 RepID=D0AAD6_TRYB9|nr:hypothetical protein, conserved [Trypanosoma brucei gambiense DAL972]CBH18637.1 hypothetical protein, conserved [Trypanosoma brucei gambiense DAL972]|eukprot:XP_011780901.1 hypothetical protein, conserved [Trypanosoma brucei gambiense DAL972]